MSLVTASHERTLQQPRQVQTYILVVRIYVDCEHRYFHLLLCCHIQNAYRNLPSLHQIVYVLSSVCLIVIYYGKKIPRYPRDVVYPKDQDRSDLPFPKVHLFNHNQKIRYPICQGL